MSITRDGFTLVELLVVIVVIAILSAVTIVAFNGIQTRAHRSAVSSDVSNIRKKLEIYKTLEGTYPHSATQDTSEVYAQLTSIDMHLSTGSYSKDSGNVYFATRNDGTRFFLLAIAKNSPAVYASNTTNGARDYASDFPSCPSFPGGSGAQIARCVGMSDYPDDMLQDVTIYYIYTVADGFRVWNN